MSRVQINIAIDGPASSGKGTVARLVAQALGFQYIDTGAMFRAVALHAHESSISLNDVTALRAMVQTMRFQFQWLGGELRLSINGRDVTDAIRTEEVGGMASNVALHQPVRSELLRQQQELAKDCCVVMDGRDIGSVVLPDAHLKIYLDASATERGRRRLLDLQNRGIVADFDALVGEIKARDDQDKNREHDQG